MLIKILIGIIIYLAIGVYIFKWILDQDEDSLTFDELGFAFIVVILWPFFCLYIFKEEYLATIVFRHFYR